MADAHHWIQNAIKKPGALHKALGVKKGEPIGMKLLNKTADMKKNTVNKKRAVLSKTLEGFHKK